MIRTFLKDINTTFLNPIDNDDVFNANVETILKTITVNAGEIESDFSAKTLTLSMVASKPITNASTYQFKMYFNSANTLVNAVTIGVLNTSSADTTPVMVRTFSINNTLNNEGLLDALSTTNSSYNDWGELTPPLGSSFPVPSPQTGVSYFILTGRRTSATSDTVSVKNFVLEL
jgi:hypothetical protein